MNNPEPQAQNEKIVYTVDRILTLIALAVLLILFAFRQIYSPDIGFHLRAGEWMIHNLSFPSHDTFTYTSDTHDYIDMHWLYQVIVAIINNASGEFGLVASHAILIMLSFILLYMRSMRIDRKASNWQILFFLAVTSTAVFFETRPQILSWVLFNSILMVLEDYNQKGKGVLFFLPVIMLIWANTHTLFILGLVVIFSYVMGMVFREKKIWTPLTKYALLSVAVSFLNPYFVKGVGLPFVQFQLLQPHNMFKDGIAELASPMSFNSYFFNGKFVFFQPLMWFQVILVIGVLSFIFRLRKIQLQEFIIFGLFLYLALSGIRNISYFVFAVVPATIGGLRPSDDLESAEPGKQHSLKKLWQKIGSRRGQIIANVIVMIASITMIIAVVTDLYYINYRSNDRFGYRYNNYFLPEKASTFLRDNRLDGKILNQFNFGGFLIHAIPQKIFIDGRTEVTGDTFFYRYSILWNQIDKQPIIDKYNPDIIIFPHQNEFLWVHYLKADTAWRLAYVDELAAIYLRKGYAENLHQWNPGNSMSEYRKFDSLEINDLIKAPYPSGYPLFKMTKQYFPLKEMGLSTFYYYNDQYDAAIQIGLNGLVRSTLPCPELYYNLGHYFFENKDFGRSAYCYQRFLQSNSDGLATERLKMIRSGKIKIWNDK